MTVIQKYKFLFVYKVASISEVRQFGLSNSPYQKIKTNFRDGEKIYRMNVVVFTANHKFKFLQDDGAVL